MYGYNWQNPYQNYANQLPRTSVKKVTGMEGANLYPMAPDSSELLLDSSGLICYLVTTDSLGVKSVQWFAKPEEEKHDLSDFETRLKKLEEMFNAKSDSASTKSKKSE